jgi:hypothetical protein
MGMSSGYKDISGTQTDEDSIATIKRAKELGVTFLGEIFGRKFMSSLLVWSSVALWLQADGCSTPTAGTYNRSNHRSECNQAGQWLEGFVCSQ